MLLAPNASEDGAVDLFIPATSIPTGQVANVFYVDESGAIDTYSLIVSEGAQTFLQNVATTADPQVKAAYADVNAVSSDTYLESTAADIRAAGVTPLPMPPAVYRLMANEFYNNSESYAFHKYLAYIINQNDESDFHVVCEMNKTQEDNPNFVLNGFAFTNDGSQGEFQGVLHRIQMYETRWNDLPQSWKSEKNISSPEQVTLEALYDYMGWTGDADPAMPYDSTAVSNETALRLVTQSGGNSWIIQ